MRPLVASNGDPHGSPRRDRALALSFIYEDYVQTRLSPGIFCALWSLGDLGSVLSLRTGPQISPTNTLCVFRATPTTGITITRGGKLFTLSLRTQRTFGMRRGSSKRLRARFPQLSLSARGSGIGNAPMRSPPGSIRKTGMRTRFF